MSLSTVVQSAQHMPKLHCNNYDTWSVRIRALLTAHDMWTGHIVDLPSDTESSAKWLMTDRHVRLVLLCSVNNSLLSLLENRSDTTAQAMWRSLADAFAPRTLGAELRLHHQIQTYRYDASESAVHNIARLRHMGDQRGAVSVAGDTYPEVLLIHTFLTSVPHWLRSVVTELDDGQPLTWARVTVRTVEAEALHTRGGGGGGGGSRRATSSSCGQYLLSVFALGN